jgi:predicted phosphodiesterase
MLKIAIMGDLHYSQVEQSNKALWQAREAFFNQYVQAFAEIKADLRVSVGDLTHHGLAEEFLEVSALLSPVASDFCAVLGNHDVLAIPKEEILAITRQPRYEAVETEEALLLFLDTTVSLSLNGCDLDDEQFEWFQQQLTRSPHKPLLMFVHHPLLAYAFGRTPTEANLHRKVYPLLLSRKNGGVVFNGHTHFHKTVMVGAWHAVETAGSLCFPCFRLVEVEAGQIRVSTIALDDAELLRNSETLRDGIDRYHQPKEKLYHKADLQFTISN